MNELQEKILALKKQRDCLILAHYYQPLDVQDIADAVGDSFALAKRAQSATQSAIIMCGVRFMAESAKILNPGKTVWLPVEGAGCPMADTITAEAVLALKKRYPEAAVVCYVNSTAAVKAVSDVCCTSSSAEQVVRSLPNRQILFVPDKNLGAYIAKQLPDKEVILYDGCCPIHDGVTREQAEAARRAHPEAKLLVHPECPEAVVALADYVGSTAGILKAAREDPTGSYLIGTENGVTEILARELPLAHIYALKPDFVCEDMKKTTLADVLACLEGRRAPLELPRSEMDGARAALERMIAVS